MKHASNSDAAWAQHKVQQLLDQAVLALALIAAAELERIAKELRARR